VPSWSLSTRARPTDRPRRARHHCGFNDPATLADWHPRLEYVEEAPMYDSPVLMAKAPANIRRMYRLINLLPGMKRSTVIVRFRF
jgi:O-methyltransferase